MELPSAIAEWKMYLSNPLYIPLDPNGISNQCSPDVALHMTGFKNNIKQRVRRDLCHGSFESWLTVVPVCWSGDSTEGNLYTYVYIILLNIHNRIAHVQIRILCNYVYIYTHEYVFIYIIIIFYIYCRTLWVFGTHPFIEFIKHRTPWIPSAWPCLGRTAKRQYKMPLRTWWKWLPNRRTVNHTKSLFLWMRFDVFDIQWSHGYLCVYIYMYINSRFVASAMLYIVIIIFIIEVDMSQKKRWLDTISQKWFWTRLTRSLVVYKLEKYEELSPRKARLLETL
jgi:hypothetical protein